MVKVIFVDIEATGFQEPVRPIQIGAIDTTGLKEFNCFMVPDKQLTDSASKVTGLSTDLVYLYKDGVKVTEAVDLKVERYMISYTLHSNLKLVLSLISLLTFILQFKPLKQKSAILISPSQKPISVL